MAMKSTICKAVLDVSDVDRNYYAEHALTIARHPSETDERMMMRLIAFALNAHEHLTFGKGLAEDDAPDLWHKDLTGAIAHWIEVGQPDDKTLLRAAGRAARVTVYAYRSGPSCGGRRSPTSSRARNISPCGASRRRRAGC